MKVAFLTADNREYYRDYKAKVPLFATAPEALLQGLTQMPEVEVHVISCIRKPVAAPEKVGPNIFFHSLHVPKLGWIRTGYQGCIRATRKKIKSIGPDIVHGQGTELESAICAVFSGFPSVLTLHGNMRLIAQVNKAKPFSFYWLAGRLEALTIPRSLGVVCITRYTQQAVSDLAKRTWVVPNAVDSAFFDIQVRPPPDKPPRILFVGTVGLRKNQNPFIRALDPLADKQPFELVFVGLVLPGRVYDDEFLALIKDRPWCRMAGLVNREDLKAMLREASLLALPSLEDNCPMVVLEAMAAGLPVLAANVAGLPDLIEEGKTGFFCDPLDADSMRTAVERALANSAAREAVAREAKQKARERFHPAVIARRHLEIYREVLASVS